MTRRCHGTFGINQGELWRERALLQMRNLIRVEFDSKIRPYLSEASRFLCPKLHGQTFRLEKLHWRPPLVLCRHRPLGDQTISHKRAFPVWPLQAQVIINPRHLALLGIFCGIQKPSYPLKDLGISLLLPWNLIKYRALAGRSISSNLIAH